MKLFSETIIFLLFTLVLSHPNLIKRSRFGVTGYRPSSYGYNVYPNAEVFPWQNKVLSSTFITTWRELIDQSGSREQRAAAITDFACLLFHDRRTQMAQTIHVTQTSFYTLKFNVLGARASERQILQLTVGFFSDGRRIYEKEFPFPVDGVKRIQQAQFLLEEGSYQFVFHLSNRVSHSPIRVGVSDFMLEKKDVQLPRHQASANQIENGNFGVPTIPPGSRSLTTLDIKGWNLNREGTLVRCQAYNPQFNCNQAFMFQMGLSGLTLSQQFAIENTRINYKLSFMYAGSIPAPTIGRVEVLLNGVRIHVFKFSSQEAYTEPGVFEQTVSLQDRNQLKFTASGPQAYDVGLMISDVVVTRKRKRQVLKQAFSRLTIGGVKGKGKKEIGGGYPSEQSESLFVLYGEKPRGSDDDKPRGSGDDKPRGSDDDKPRGSGDKPRGSGDDKPRGSELNPTGQGGFTYCDEPPPDFQPPSPPQQGRGRGKPRRGRGGNSPAPPPPPTRGDSKLTNTSKDSLQGGQGFQGQERPIRDKSADYRKREGRFLDDP